MILGENSHRKVHRLAKSIFQYYFPICHGRLCVRDFIGHNSSKVSKGTFLAYSRAVTVLKSSLFSRYLPIVSFWSSAKITTITRSSKPYLSYEKYKKPNNSLSFITHIMLSRTSLIPAVYGTRMNVVNMSLSEAQWLEFMGSNPAENSDFFLCPTQRLVFFSLGLAFQNEGRAGPAISHW